MDYFGRIASGEDYLADDWTWRERLLRQRQAILEDSRPAQPLLRTRTTLLAPLPITGRGAATSLVEPLDLAMARSSAALAASAAVTTSANLCGNCCQRISSWTPSTPIEDDVTIRALPDLTDVTYYPMPGLTSSPNRFDYLTSRRYPYNRTMTDLVDDIRREQILSDTTRTTTSASSSWSPVEPRVVETSYYENYAPPRMTRANSMENVYVPQDRIRRWEGTESIYEKGPSWYAQKRNEDFPLRGSYHTSYTAFAPYKHVHNEYPTYRRESRPMSRYVYEVKPYHTVRELEMDRIMKTKYQNKFFAKKEKKYDEINVPKKIPKISDQPDEKMSHQQQQQQLSVPEHEPFRKAFAVNGISSDESSSRQHKPADNYSTINGNVNHQEETEVEPIVEKVVKVQLESPAPVVVAAQPVDQPEETLAVVEPEVAPEPEEFHPVPEVVAEPEPEEAEQKLEPEAPQAEELVANEKEAAAEPEQELQAEPEMEEKVEIQISATPVAEQQPREEPVQEELVEAVQHCDEEESNPIPEAPTEPDVEEVSAVQAPDTAEVEAKAEEEAVEEAQPEVVEEIEAVQAGPETLDENLETSQIEMDDSTQPEAEVLVEEVIETAEETEAHEETVDESSLDARPEKITIIKTGQILIEETDLGNDECIRTEYEIEEIQIEKEVEANEAAEAVDDEDVEAEE